MPPALSRPLTGLALLAALSALPLPQASAQQADAGGFQQGGAPAQPIEDLSTAVAACLDTASEITSARRMRDALAAAVDTARSAYFPSLDAFGRGGGQLDRGSKGRAEQSYSTEARIEAGLTFRLVLYDWGARDARVGAAKAAVQGGDATVRETINDILLRCTSVYLDLMRQRETFEATEENRRNHQRFLQLAERKETLGETGETPVLTARARLHTKERERAEELMKLRQIDSAFRHMTARAPGALVEPTLTDPAFGNTAVLVETAQARSPALQRAKAAYEAAEQGYVAARADRGPTLSLGGDASLGRNTEGVRDQDKSGSLLLTLNVPIFDGGLRQAKGMEAADALGRARSDLVGEQRKLEERIRRLHGDHRDSAEILRWAAIELQDKDRLVRLYEREVDTRGRPINDLLAAADDLAKTRIIEATARYQRVLALLSLAKDVGELPDVLGAREHSDRLATRLQRDKPLGLVWAGLPAPATAGAEPGPAGGIQVRTVP